MPDGSGFMTLLMILGVEEIACHRSILRPSSRGRLRSRSALTRGERRSAARNTACFRRLACHGLLYRPAKLPSFRTLLRQFPGKGSEQIAIGVERLNLEPGDATLSQPGPIILKGSLLRTVAHRVPPCYIQLYSHVFFGVQRLAELVSVPANEDGPSHGFGVLAVAIMTRRPSFEEGDYKYIIATMAIDPRTATTLPPASIRSDAKQAIDLQYVFILPTRHHLASLSRSGVFRARTRTRTWLRPRRTTADRLRVVADAAREPAGPASSKPDPRLVNLVRLLARQAARDFIQAETDNRMRDRSRSKEVAS